MSSELSTESGEGYAEMAVGDIYQVVFESFVSGEDNSNVFHFLMTDDGGTGEPAEDLFTAFEDTLVPLHADTLSVNWAGKGLSVINLADLDDFKEAQFAADVDGTRPGENIASVACWSFRLNRAVPGQRSGWKRLSGISETDVYGQVAQAGVLPSLAAYAVGLTAGLTEDSKIWELAVVKRPIVYGTNPTVYYLPNTADYAGVGSQVSRKRPFIGG